MSNIYHDSESLVADLRSGNIPIGSIIKVQWPSGNYNHIRVHGYDVERDRLIGCDMGWDNSASESFDLSKCVVSLAERATPEVQKAWEENS